MSNKTVFVVDDNPINLKVTSMQLTHLGFEVRTATNAEDALKALQSWQPAVIVTDIQLPGMDGLALTRRLKADPATHDIVILALTGSAMPEDEERVRAAGCDGFITKSNGMQALATTIDACVNLHRNRSNDHVAKDSTERSAQRDDEPLDGVWQAMNLTALANNSLSERVLVGIAASLWTTVTAAQCAHRPFWHAYTGQHEDAEGAWGWLTMIHPDDQERIKRQWQEAMTTPTLYESLLRIRGSDDCYRAFGILGIPIFQQGNVVQAWQGLCLPFPDLHSNNERLSQEQRLTLYAVARHFISRPRPHANTSQRQGETPPIPRNERQSNQGTQAFFTKTTHDMRSALGVIGGYTELLLSEELGSLVDEQRESLHDILLSTQQIVSLIAALVVHNSD